MRALACFAPLRFAGVAALFLFHSSAHAQSLDVLVAQALSFAAQQLTATVAEVGDPTLFPRSTLADGSWRLEDSGSWTSGFFPGCLWLLHEAEPTGPWRAWAEAWTAEMEDEKTDNSTHDVGFKIFCSFGNGYRLTGNTAYASVVLRGAQSLASRFNPVVGCTRSWDNRHFPVIIDNMMNLEILWWAAAHGGTHGWADMAVSHALRTRQDHVRAAGSTYHLVDYDPVSGTMLSRGTVQGYADTSTWARGQAWGIYGFTMAYRESGDTRFLGTAESLADYFIDHLPPDHVPYWDFDAANIPNEPRDSSAAAIAAAGLLELCRLDPDAAARVRYRNAAFAILAALCAPPYLATGSSSHGILLHGVGNRPKNTEVDVSLIYGDYYFIQALLRYRGVVSDSPAALLGYTMAPGTPNPFNPDTRIDYHVPVSVPVCVLVYDARGVLVRRLVDEIVAAGDHSAAWDGNLGNGKAAPSGTYFVRLTAGSFTDTQKLTLVR